MSNVTAEPCTAGRIRPDAGKIRQFRTTKGFTQERLAEAANCGRKTIQNIEDGKCCYLHTLRAMADVFGVEVAVLYFGTPPELPAKFVEIQVVLKVPYLEFDQSEQLGGVIGAIMAMVKNNPAIVLKVGSGSTVITLAMSPEDADALARLLMPISLMEGDGSDSENTRIDHRRAPTCAPEYRSLLPDVLEVSFPDDEALSDASRRMTLLVNG